VIRLSEDSGINERFLF